MIDDVPCESFVIPEPPEEVVRSTQGFRKYFAMPSYGPGDLFEFLVKQPPRLIRWEWETFPKEEKMEQYQTRCHLCKAKVKEVNTNITETPEGRQVDKTITFECGTVVSDHDCEMCREEGAAGPALERIGEHCIKAYLK